MTVRGMASLVFLTCQYVPARPSSQPPGGLAKLSGIKKEQGAFREPWLQRQGWKGEGEESEPAQMQPKSEGVDRCEMTIQLNSYR